MHAACLLLLPFTNPLPAFCACLQAAVDMMRKVLNEIKMDGVVVIGEGEKDEVRGGQSPAVICNLFNRAHLCIA